MTDICFYITHNAISKTYKFFFLAEQLKKLGFFVNTVLCSTEMSGVRPGEFNDTQISNMKENNIFILSKKEMTRHVQKNRYKYFVVGTYSGDLSEILGICKAKGAKTIEISTIAFNDPIEHNADINLMISKLAFKAALNKRPQRAKRAKNIYYVGSLFSDDIPNTYTSHLRSIEDFKNKYHIGNKRLFLWMPGRDDMEQIKMQKQIANQINDEQNMLMLTTHPWSEKYQKNLINNIKRYIPIVDSADVYWTFKTMTSAIAHRSTSGIELAAMKKPVVYIEQYTRRPFLNKYVKPVGYLVKSVKSLRDAINTLNFAIDDKKYEEQLNKIYPSPYRPAWERICEFFEEIRKNEG